LGSAIVAGLRGQHSGSECLIQKLVSHGGVGWTIVLLVPEACMPWKAIAGELSRAYLHFRIPDNAVW